MFFVICFQYVPRVIVFLCVFLMHKNITTHVFEQCEYYMREDFELEFLICYFINEPLDDVFLPGRNECFVVSKFIFCCHFVCISFSCFESIRRCSFVKYSWGMSFWKIVCVLTNENTNNYENTDFPGKFDLFQQ